MTRAAPLFLLSFRHRDALAAMAEQGGWRPIAARRADRIERRFLASGASVAVIDMRGAFGPGLAAVQALADAVGANAGALFVLIEQGDIARLGEIYDAGATHYLAEPFGEAEFVQMLRFAARHSERIVGGALRGETGFSDGGGWRWAPGATFVTLDAHLAAQLGAPPTFPLRAAARSLGRDGTRAAREAVRRLLAGQAGTAFAHGRADGERIAHHLHSEEDGASIVGQVERIDADARMRGRRDPLTGLADARGARLWLAKRLSEQGGGAGPVLLIIGVPRLETVNAAFGRTTGDQLLRGVARRIEEVLGTTPRRLVARIAGSEFAVGLPAPATIAEAQLLADGLVAAIARPFVADGHVVTLAPRIGIAAADAQSEPAAILRRASLALAEARGSERPVRVLGAGEEDEAARLTMLGIDLRRALDKDEIELLWQPQVGVSSGAIVGVEALARWRHPALGDLGAELLFAVAERSDHLVALSDHVQRKAVALLAAWPESLAALRVSINVVAADIARPGFAPGLLRIIRDAGVDSGRITVEITESGLIEDLGAAATLLAELRAGGLRIAIDDFGTGYSSLAYLKALPLDYLKLDKRLSEDITGSARDSVVVRGVIEMARSLGLGVIAEGVETEEQLTALAREGCTLYQGFLCAPPLSTGALAALVEAKRRAGA